MAEELTKTQQDQRTNELKNLLNSAGWRVVVGIIDQHIQVTTDMILTGYDANGQELKEDEIKNARIVLAVWKKMRAIPEETISENTPIPVLPVTNDVYDVAPDLTVTKR